MKHAKRYLTAAVTGILVGMLTLIGQKYLPVNLNFLANSGAVWLIPAFLCSYFGKSGRLRSIAVAILCLLGCVYGYYIFEAVLNRHAFTIGRGPLLWSAISFAAGVVFGLGAFFANQERGKLKYLGANLLPAVFTAEGLDNVLHIQDYSHMIPAVILKMIVGVLLYLAINGKAAIRLKNFTAYAAVTALGTIAFAILSIGM